MEVRAHCVSLRADAELVNLPSSRVKMETTMGTKERIEVDTIDLPAGKKRSKERRKSLAPARSGLTYSSFKCSGRRERFSSKNKTG